jgi:hypothetical protein
LRQIEAPMKADACELARKWEIRLPTWREMLKLLNTSFHCLATQASVVRDTDRQYAPDSMG